MSPSRLVGPDGPSGPSLTPWLLGLLGALLMGLAKVLQPKLAAMLSSQDERLRRYDKSQQDLIELLRTENKALRSGEAASHQRELKSSARNAALEAELRFLRPGD